MIVKPVKPLTVVYRYYIDDEFLGTHEAKEEIDRFLKTHDRTPDGSFKLTARDKHEPIEEYNERINIMKILSEHDSYYFLSFKNWMYYYIILNDGYVSRNLGMVNGKPVEAIQELIDHLQGKDNDAFVDLDDIVF